MSSSLRRRLDELASAFASGVLDAIRAASLDDLVGVSPTDRPRAAPRAKAPAPAVAATPGRSRGSRRGGRLARRSAGDIAGVVDRIAALLRTSAKGLRAEQIRQKLGLQAKEMPRPLKEGLSSGRLGKSGRKRATTYFVKGAGVAAPAVSSAARPAAAKKARKPAGKAPARKARTARKARKK
jgi:hypothetical protein